MFQVDDRTGAEQVAGLFPEYARRQQVKRKLAKFVDDSMTGVVPALVTHDNVIL
ncbi:hypothetical protein SDC9_176785 [bioreactor metagenome]|uniref:Uncharacterized protein n=1 Tax=bioreactor metagenome TaxID=1076179 RepID=A0A645GTP3_9ZZZZ